MSTERELSLPVDLWPTELELIAVALASYVIYGPAVRIQECLDLEDKLGIGDKVTRWIDELHHDTGDDEYA